MTPEQIERADYIKSILPQRFPVKAIDDAGIYKEVTMRSMISRDIGPKVFRIGGRVIIDRDHFISWLNELDAERLQRNEKIRAGIMRAKKEKAEHLRDARP